MRVKEVVISVQVHLTTRSEPKDRTVDRKRKLTDHLQYKYPSDSETSKEHLIPLY